MKTSNKWVPLITKSNNAINFRFPGLDYIRGNDAADQLATGPMKMGSSGQEWEWSSAKGTTTTPTGSLF